MQFSEESELMFRRQLECTRLGDRFIYGGSLLLGDFWDLLENLVQHAVNPRSRLIHLSEQHHFFYSVLDHHGLLLMQIAMDMMLSGRLQHYLYRNHVTDYGGIEYLGFLEGLTQFYVPKSGKTKRDPPQTGYFFDFQIPAIQKFCSPKTNLFSISSQWLDGFEREYCTE